MNQNKTDVFCLKKCRQVLAEQDFYTRKGRINKVVGMTIEATGLVCSIGDVCLITPERGSEVIEAEVVGVEGKHIFLMPYRDTDGIGYNCEVVNTKSKMTVKVSEDMIGRTFDALGQPLDGGSVIEKGTDVPVDNAPPNPMERPPITEVIEMGVKAIDGLMTIGKGQRMGIFAGSGVGKSTLMGMIARNVKADINVIALVGERGREVVEFIERDLGEEGKKRSILIVATSDQPALMRHKCAQTATAIAEYFQQQGKDVLLMMDSLTRFCMAQREIGLATGEAPVARGYTPSIYSALPRLLERSGNFKTGSITGVYTVLVEGDDTNEPIADTVRSIIDGHIFLSRKIASRNHYPAIDVLNSLSRLMNGIASESHKEAAGKMRNMMSVYRDNEDLISIGAYKPGSNPRVDGALSHQNKINQFLQQRVDEKFTFDEMLVQLKQAVE